MNEMRRAVRVSMSALLACCALATSTTHARQAPRASGASPLASELDKLAAAVEPELLEWRRYLHQHPELSNREIETAKYVAERLKSFGL